MTSFVQGWFRFWETFDQPFGVVCGFWAAFVVMDLAGELIFGFLKAWNAKF